MNISHRRSSVLPGCEAKLPEFQKLRSNEKFIEKLDRFDDSGY